MGGRAAPYQFAAATFSELKTTPKALTVGIVVARCNFDAFESQKALVCLCKEKEQGTKSNEPVRDDSVDSVYAYQIESAIGIQPFPLSEIYLANQSTVDACQHDHRCPPRAAAIAHALPDETSGGLH